MRVVLIAVSAATLAIVLVVGLGGVEAASFPGASLTNSEKLQQSMSVTTVGIRRTTTVTGEIHRTPPVTVTTATRFVNCSACGQKRIGREACGASPIDKVRRTISKGSNLQPPRTKADDLLGDFRRYQTAPRSGPGAPRREDKWLGTPRRRRRVP